MPRPRNAVPTYQHHKPSNRAYVRIPDGSGGRKAVYLGEYGSAESREAYARVVAQAHTGTPIAAPPGSLQPDISVNEALVAYFRHVTSYYPENSARNHRDALRPVRIETGALLLREFTPKAFKRVRQGLIDKRLSRTTINNRMGKVAQFVKWCVAEELAAPALYAALRTVPGLRKGRGEAKELPPVRAPRDEDVAKVLGRLPPAAAALARVQMLCGARAGELVSLRGDTIDRTGLVWVAAVEAHKGEWRGKARTLYFGPVAQEVLAPLVAKAAAGPLFVNAKGRPYRVNGYRQALQRGCTRVGVAEFGTHALRHYAATKIRAAADVETARVLLGHSDMGLTAAVYAEFDQQKAIEAMKRVG